MVDRERSIRVGLIAAFLAAISLSGGAAQTLYPENLLGIGEGESGHALLVEKDTEKLFLYRVRGAQLPELVRSWNATTGMNGGDKSVRGDHRTPEGVYFFTRFIEDQDLPAEYGARALVMDYPNLFDARAGKTGDGIWLHATDEIVRPLTSRRTRGCVVVTNRDVMEISRFIELGETPIIVQEQIRRVDRSRWQAQRDELLRFVERWRAAWSAADFDRYAESYAVDFRLDGKDRSAWLAQKAASFQEGGRFEVATSNLRLYRDHDQALVQFGQIYRSETAADYGRKSLWLEKRAGQWAIVAEEWRAAVPPRELAGQVLPLVPLVAAGRPPATPAPVLVASLLPPAGASDEDAGSVLSVASAPPRIAVVAESGQGTPAAPVERAPTALAVREFLADAGPGDVRVSFRLERSEPGRVASSGWLSVVVRLHTPKGPRNFVWPGGQRLDGENPVRSDAGDSYSIRRFKQVDATLEGIPAGSVLERVSLHIYDRQGRRLVHEVFGG